MSEMRILFVISDARTEPLGVEYLSAVLKRAGHQVRLASIAEENVAAIASEYRPRLIGYNMLTGWHQEQLALNRRLKQQMNFFAACGGPHATFFPQLIEEEEAVDGVCIGEGEEALLELVERLEAGQPVTGVANWWIRQDGQVYKNPPRPLIHDLDRLPFPDRGLSEYLKAYRRFRTMHTVITGRGCPYDCTYCFNHAYMDIYGHAWRKVRRRSVDNVVAEAAALKAEGTTFINFVDDTFIVMQSWIEEFAPRFAREVGLKFSANVRANLVTDDLIRLLREAGCHSVTMGVETADPRLRNEVLKRNMSTEQIVEAAEIVRRHGILLYTSNIVGIPTGNLAADLETLRLNVALKPYASSAGLLQPYPGTQIRRFAEERGLIGTTVDDIPLTLFHETVIKMEPGERRQVENLSHLFNVVVKAPWLLPIAPWLFKLPLNKLYFALGMLSSELTTSRRILLPPPRAGFYWRRFLLLLKRKLSSVLA